MTPHLHPRSKLTTSLFGTTLLVSFLVVGMPHIIPCPAPRVKFTEGEYYIMEDGRRMRRRPIAANGSRSDESEEDVLSVEAAEGVEKVVRKKAHECPVPKPRGIIGEVLGFKKEKPNEQLQRQRVETKPLPRLRKDDS